MKILDATCGVKAMWFNKNHPLVTYLDKRNGNYTSWNKTKAKRNTAHINPDVVADWTKELPFDNEYFDMVLFDPPHIIQSKPDKSNCMTYYGYLPSNNWDKLLKLGIDELFRVLKPEGVFIFKWAERAKPIKEIIKLFPYPPIFGNRTWKANPAKSNEVYWLVFLKYNVNGKLDIN